MPRTLDQWMADTAQACQVTHGVHRTALPAHDLVVVSDQLRPLRQAIRPLAPTPEAVRGS